MNNPDTIQFHPHIVFYALVTTASIIVPLIVGIYALCIRIAPQLIDRRYRIAKRILGMASIIVGIGNVVLLITASRPYTDLFSFITLVVAQLQACMFTFLVFVLLQSDYVRWRNITRHLLPTAIVVVVYILMRFFADDHRIYNFAHYTPDPLLVFRTLFALLYGVQIGIYIVLFRRERHIYNKKIDNYFSDTGLRERRWASQLFWQATGVGIAVLLYLAAPSLVTVFVIKVIVSVLYLSFGIRFINYQYTILHLTPALQQESEPKPEKTEMDSSTIATLASMPPLYLRQGITLTDYAAALCVSPRRLSAHINTTYGETFKRWINRQRVEYAQTLIEQHPEMNMEEIAEQSGFANKGHLSKALKEHTGKSFTEHRKG